MRRRPRRRRPVCVDTAAVPRGGTASSRRRRVGHPAPGAPRRGTHETRRDPVLGAVADRRRRRRDRRAGSGRGDVPVPGKPVGTADHRAVSSRAARPMPCATYQRVRAVLGEEARPRPRTAAPAARATDPGPRPRRPCRGGARSAAAGNLPSMSVELVGRESELAALSDLVAASGLSRSSDRAASERRRSRSQPVER